jgi:predicted glycoside hydrolase/deacetylase ChbG (UPF0249 family)
MRYLILNADDCGYCPEETRAVSDLMTNGLITSTTLLTVAEDSENAAKMLASHGRTSGIHLAVTCDDEERRWKPLSAAPSLSDEKGLFVSGDKRITHARRSDVREELEAQYRWMTARGCFPDHADAHSMTLYGLNGRRFFLDVFDFCEEHQLPFRFPQGLHFAEQQLGKSIPAPLRLLVNYVRREAQKRHLLMPDDLSSNPWNVERIGSLDNLRSYYLNELETMGEGVTEMFLHPSYDAPGRGPEWQKRVWERQILESGCLVERAKQLDIRLISWRDLRQMKRGG